MQSLKKQPAAFPGLVNIVSLLSLPCTLAFAAGASQQPPQPTDITPSNGEVYYVVNQLSGLQADLNNNSTLRGDRVTQKPRSFNELSQRWAFIEIASGLWRISNVANGMCLDGKLDVASMCAVTQNPSGIDSPVCKRSPRGRSAEPDAIAAASSPTYVVQEPCAPVDTQQWVLTPVGNGYYEIANKGDGLLIDLAPGSTPDGAALIQMALNGAAAQSQMWLLRPAFFRGIDNALLEKQEAARLAAGVSWWKDAGQPQDVLRIMKNHGVNMVRLRPSSSPPYIDPSQAQCAGNACYAETDEQDLDLALRAKRLGMSVELTLLFDGGNSASVPPAWAGDTQLAELQSDVYDYVKTEIESFRRAGAMPDLVSIGNEVDTGFLGALGSPTGADFGGFAALQITAVQAVRDAAADTADGPPLPAPLTCIHITPAWDLTQFFTLVSQNIIPYDAICQSYYPLFHGPLTDSQAASSNPNGKPVEQDVLMNAVNKIGKPIFIIETGEHYENGFDSNDPWYAPPSETLQRQFLLDVQAVLKGLPNNLSMGVEYWNPAGVNIPKAGNGFYNGDNLPDAIYSWNGWTLFDNADTSGATDATASNYSALLSGVDALGGKLDPTISYEFVNAANGRVLTVFHGSLAAGAALDAETANGNPTLSQQWRITSRNDGFFQIASLNPGPDGATNVLDDSGASSASGNAIVQSPSGSSPQLEWNIVSAGSGFFLFVNRASGLVLDLNGGLGAQAGFAVQEPANGAATQEWQIVPVH